MSPVNLSEIIIILLVNTATEVSISTGLSARGTDVFRSPGGEDAAGYLLNNNISIAPVWSGDRTSTEAASL